MTKVKEKAKKGLVDNVVVEKLVTPEIKKEEVSCVAGVATRAYRQ